MLAQMEVRTIKCFLIVPNYLPSCADEFFDALLIHYLYEFAREKKEREREKRRKETQQYAES